MVWFCMSSSLLVKQQIQGVHFLSKSLQIYTILYNQISFVHQIQFFSHFQIHRKEGKWLSLQLQRKFLFPKKRFFSLYHAIYKINQIWPAQNWEIIQKENPINLFNHHPLMMLWNVMFMISIDSISKWHYIDAQWGSSCPNCLSNPIIACLRCKFYNLPIFKSPPI